MGNKKKEKYFHDEKYRWHVSDNILISQNSFDKVLLALSSGALGISLTLIDSLVISLASQYKYFLIVSWISWVLSLILLLFSHMNSVKAWEKTLDQYDEGILLNCYDNIGEPYNSRVGYCNKSGFLFFIIGTICFITYVIISL
jgi:hypothetical protein